MIKTNDELKAATDRELDELLDKIAGKPTADFQNITGCEFAYSTLSNELIRRGYVNSWHKPKQRKKEITVKMLKKPDRFNLPMTPECKKAFEEFVKTNGWTYVHTTAALQTYMEAYRRREIKVSIDV